MAGPSYPAFEGRRRSLAAALAAGGGRVGGRVVIRSPADACWLVDETACVRLAGVDGERCGAGDWVSGRLVVDGRGPIELRECTRHTPRRGRAAEPELGATLATLRRRAEMIDAARGYFRGEGFLEVETPTRVVCPGLEPHLVAFPAGRDRYLITSPELHLKRLLAAGAERVVEFARAFRDDEAGPWHLDEFTMLEWYRTFAGLDDLERDCEGLVAACAAALGRPTRIETRGCRIDAPFDRTTVRRALLERTGLDLARLSARDDLGRAIAERGHAVPHDADWDELFFRVWIAEVEPMLGIERPVFVHEYPASQAALARTRRASWGEVAERFELYMCGVEVANAFAELNDPDEQRRRHEADRATRAAVGAPVYPLDERFLEALERGMPPASGIALGLDRLMALLLGFGSLAEMRVRAGEPGG